MMKARLLAAVAAVAGVAWLAWRLERELDRALNWGRIAEEGDPRPASVLAEHEVRRAHG